MPSKDDWFFTCWQPDKVTRASAARTVPFHASRTRSSWRPIPTAGSCIRAQHGTVSQGLEEDYCMLDPIKVSIVTPGMRRERQAGRRPVFPPPCVTAYLDREGIEVEKTTDFTILFLFSLGITKGKWGTLVNALLDFKRDYDANSRWSGACPTWSPATRRRYAGMGLKDLADEIVRRHEASCKTTANMARRWHPAAQADDSARWRPTRSWCAATSRLVTLEQDRRAHRRHRHRAIPAGHSDR